MSTEAVTPESPADAHAERARPACGAAVPSPAELRSVLGRFASGVTVVTGADAAGPVGFACQSFASVSLDPPLVLFCADHGGRAWPRIRASGTFTVNVLAEDQTELCTRFGSRHGRKFEALEWDPSPHGAPSLRGVLARIHATVQTVHTAGDHDIAVGLVHTLEPCREGRPMVFYRGRFGVEGTPDTASESVGWGLGWDAV